MLSLLTLVFVSLSNVTLVSYGSDPCTYRTGYDECTRAELPGDAYHRGSGREEEKGA